jgi:hypothetical protein
MGAAAPAAGVRVLRVVAVMPALLRHPHELTPGLGCRKPAETQFCGC